MILIRVGHPQYTRAGDITRTRDKSQGRIKDKIDQLGRIFLGLNVERTKESSNTHPDQPRASSRVNDNQCVSFLPLRLLAGSSPQETMNTLSVVKFNVVHPVPSAPGHSQKNEISPGAADCQSKQSKLKFMKGVSCVIPLSCAKLVINAPNVATCHKSTCRGKTPILLEKLAGSGGQSKGSSNPQGGVHPPLPDPAELIKNSHSHKLLWQSPRRKSGIYWIQVHCATATIEISLCTR